MRAYNVSVLGDTYRIVSVPEWDARKSEDGDIIVSPGLNFDFIITTENEDAASCLCAVTAVTKWIFITLSYPRMELNFDTRAGVYTAWRDENKIYIKSPKCKSKFTKSEIEIAGIHIPLYEAQENDGILFSPCESLSWFDKSYLTSIYYRLLKDGIKAVFAAESKDGTVSFVAYPEVDKMTALLTYSEFLFASGKLPVGCAAGHADFKEELSISFDSLGEVLVSVSVG